MFPLFPIKMQLFSITFPFINPVGGSATRSSFWPWPLWPFTQAGEFASPFEKWGCRAGGDAAHRVHFPSQNENQQTCCSIFNLFCWSPVLCNNISIQTRPRHVISCPRTLRPLPHRRKLHSARGGALVVVLRFHNNSSNFHDISIPFHQKMFLCRRIYSADTCISLLERQQTTF